MEPIDSIVMSEQTFEATTYRWIARISSSGNLFMEDEHKGARVDRAWNRNRFTHWCTVDAAYRDTVLLHLLKERFKGLWEFEAWLKKKDIPSVTEYDVGGD
jgi:hypothetical protein